MTTTTTAPSAAPAVQRRDLAQVAAEASGQATTYGVHPGRPAFLDVLLADLRGLKVTLPAATTRALALSDEIGKALAAPVQDDLTAWLGAADFDEITADKIVEKMHTEVLRSAIERGVLADPLRGDAHVTGRLVTGARELPNRAVSALVDRALDALADGLDAVVEQLRGRWEPAAQIVADAVKSGIRSATRPEEVISSDAKVTAWRTLDPAITVLDRLDDVYTRLIFVCGLPMRPAEKARRGRAQWLDASSAGPVPLVLPSKRPAIPTRDQAGPGATTRTGVAAQIHGQVAAAHRRGAVVGA